MYNDVLAWERELICGDSHERWTRSRLLNTRMTNGVLTTLEELMLLRHRAGELRIGVARRVRAPLAGNYRSTFRGRGMEFDEVRIYQPGDDVRTIDWRVTARTGKTHTKLFREERERPVFLLIDQSAAMRFGTRVAFKSVVAARVAALFAWSVVSTGDRIGALVFNDNSHHELRPRPGRRGVLPLLRALTETIQSGTVATPSPQSWVMALNRSLRVVRPGSSIIVISDFRHPDEQAEQTLALLRRHCDVILVFVYDNIERELPPPGLYTISNGSDTVVLDTGLPSARQQLHDQFTQRQLWLRRMTLQHRCRVIELATNDDPITKVRQGLHSFASATVSRSVQ